MDKQQANKEINIEDIMRNIRTDILAKRVSVGKGNELTVPTGGEYLPSDFYEHLYQAALAYGETTIEMNVTKVNIPIIGGFIEMLRRKVHELVLFYVKPVVSKQKEINHHLLRALAIASEKLEEDPDFV